MKTKYLWLAAGLSSAGALFTGCSDKEDSVLPIENITIVEEGNAQDNNNITNTTETAFLGSGGSLRSLLAKTFTNIVDSDKAKLVFVDSKELETYKEDVLKAYQRGVIVAIINPDKDTVSDFCDENNLVFSADPEDLNNCSLTCFNRKSSSIIIQKRPKTGDLDDDDVPMVILSGWVEDVFNKKFNSDFRSFDIKKRFSPQNIKQVFTIDIPSSEIEESGWGVPDKMSLSTTAEINYQIYPLHSFADNAAFTGDMYLVEGTLTIHNGNLYNGRWKYNQGADQYEAFGLCLSSCNFTSSLIEKASAGFAASSNHTFMGGPAPAESTNVNYQSGFDWTFNGWITGGSGLESATPTPIFNGSWTMDNKESFSVNDLAVRTETNGGNVAYTLSVENLPGEKSTVIPEIANGDLVFHYSWIWAVPQAADDTDGRYYLQVEMNPTFNLYRIDSSKRVETKQFAPAVKTQKFLLIPPSRKEGQRVG